MNKITFNDLLVKIRFLVCLTIISVAGSAVAQIVPITDINGGFHIDGNLRADIPTIGVGDWVDGPNNGGFVLSNSGASVSPDSRLVRELYNSQSDSTFTQGSKYLDNPNTWVWTTSKAGGKGDIHNAMYTRGHDVANDEWLIFGSDRYSTNGTSYIDFELYQSTLTMTAGGGFTTAGPNGGRTINDILVTIEYGSGGSVATVFFYLWGSDGSGGFTYNLISINP